MNTFIGYGLQVQPQSLFGDKNDYFIVNLSTNNIFY